jgi:hypothetical protein
MDIDGGELGWEALTELPDSCFFGLRLIDVFTCRRHGTLHQLPTSRHEAMPMRRLLPPKCPPSSSRESVVSRRRLAWPRPAVSCPSGTLRQDNCERSKGDLEQHLNCVMRWKNKY